MSAELIALSRQARANLKYDVPLETDADPRWVDLSQARGDFSVAKILWKLGIIDNEPLETQQEPIYMLFGGHRGCGKSTELRRMVKMLQRHDRYCVVFIDALAELDIHNLRYSDILLAQAKALFDKLTEQNIKLEQVFLTRLEDWFKERIEKHDSTHDFAVEIKAGAGIESGLPFLGKIFTSITNSVRNNSTYKTEIRDSVRNYFSDFADAFNLLIGHAEQRLAEAGQGQKLLFIVDGTDRLRGDDAKNFFVRDVYQLQQIRACFVYCAPIHLLCEDGSLPQSFELARLPMIKLSDKHDPDNMLGAPLATLRDLVYRRIDRELFDGDATVDFVIRHSGGHLRDLIRLLNLCLAETLGQKRIDHDAAASAVRQLATEYRRLILQDDYPLLKKIDQSPKDYAPISEQTRRLLYDLVLLEYNAYWWRSHPAVATLNAYQDAQPAP